MNTELLPCPFCGAQPIEQAIEPHTHSEFVKAIGVPDHNGSFVIECPACECGLIAPDRETVVAAWNRRTPPQAAQGDARSESAFEHYEPVVPEDYVRDKVNERFEHQPDDLIARLRQMSVSTNYVFSGRQAARRAADEIESLRAEVVRLRQPAPPRAEVTDAMADAYELAYNNAYNTFLNWCRDRGYTALGERQHEGIRKGIVAGLQAALTAALAGGGK